jgi:hypothetical protein
VQVCAPLVRSRLKIGSSVLRCALLSRSSLKCAGRISSFSTRLNMNAISNLALSEAEGSEAREHESDILSVPEACLFLSVHRNTCIRRILASLDVARPCVDGRGAVL